MEHESFMVIPPESPALTGCLVTCGLQVQITSNHPWTACGTFAMATKYDQLWETSCGDSVAPLFYLVKFMSKPMSTAKFFGGLIKGWSRFMTISQICRHHIAKQHLWSTDAAPQKKMESKVEQPLKPTIINCFWTIMILTLQRQPQMINPKSGD